MQVKEGLSILLKYSLVSVKRPGSSCLYVVEYNRILWLLRYPVYIKLIKRKFGDEAELLLEEILQKGYTKEDDLLSTTLERLRKTKEIATLSSLKEKLNSLVIAKYLIEFSDNDIGGKPDEIKQENDAEANAKPSFWTINPDRFHQDLRDDFIVSAFTNKFDANAAELVRVLIQQMYVRTGPWAEVSNPVPIIEVKDLIKKMNSFPQLIAHFDQYVTVLGKENILLYNSFNM